MIIWSFNQMAGIQFKEQQGRLLNKVNFEIPYYKYKFHEIRNIYVNC